MSIRSNPELTRSRIAKLQSYVRSELISSKRSFICSDGPACRASCRKLPFYAGQMSYVGRHYDLEVDNRPTRIVFMGQEYGQAFECVDLKCRYDMIEDSALEGFKKRNNHMRGVTSTLRLLLGREPGLDEEGEQLLPDTHIFDGFALVNYLLCSALAKPRKKSQKGGGNGRSTAKMQRNCMRHLMATLEILDPTVIVVHGKTVCRWMTARKLLFGDGSTRRMEINGSWTDVLVFTHPSARGKHGSWGQSTESFCLKENIAPTVKEYLQGKRMIS